MPRNFHRRVEVMVPVDDPALRRRIDDEILGGELRDGWKAWRLGADGRYEAGTPGGHRCQEALMAAARRTADSAARVTVIRSVPAPVDGR
jgi:polyphosphate kinase